MINPNSDAPWPAPCTSGPAAVVAIGDAGHEPGAACVADRAAAGRVDPAVPVHAASTAARVTAAATRRTVPPTWCTLRVSYLVPMFR